MKNIINITFIVLFSVFTVIADPKISIYLTQYDSCSEKVDSSSRKDRVLDLKKLTATKPLITEDQIKSYNWLNHEIELKKGVGKQLPRPDSFGIPILIMVNGEKAYVAAIWTSLSSCGTQLPVIDWQDAQDDKFKIKLGYPVEIEIEKDPREKPLNKDIQPVN